jgi:hypothetical protein
LLAVDEDQFAGALLTTSQQRAKHHRVGASHKSLGDVTGILDAAIGDQRHTRWLAGQAMRWWIAVTCGYADARDDSRRTDRAGADPDLDRVDTRVDQSLGSTASGGDIAPDDLARGFVAGSALQFAR